MGKIARATLVIALILTPSCTAPTVFAATDFLGNHYPPACMVDLSYVNAPILFVSPKVLSEVRAKRHMAGRLWAVTYAKSLIMVDETAEGWVRDDLIRHERCHIVAGAWHPHSDGT